MLYDLSTKYLVRLYELPKYATEGCDLIFFQASGDNLE